MFEVLKADKQPLSKSLINGFGLLMSVFGATVLVPAILHVNPAPLLLALGIGSILALAITGFKIP
jgi:xanthine/uracil permease